jgi:hypothetical protein
MTWDLYLRFLSPLLTAASILFAVYTYRRASLIDRLRQLRTYLGEVPRKLIALDGLMSERGFNQVGVRIADQVLRIVGKDATVEEISGFLRDEHNRDYFIQAMHEGFYSSGPVHDLEDLVTDIDAVDLRMRSLLPSCSYFLKSALFLIRRTVENCYSPGQIARLYDETKFRDNLADEVGKAKTVGLAYAELANYISAVPGVYVQHAGQKVVNHSKSIADIIINHIISLTDEDFAKFSAADRKLPLDKKKIEEEESALKDLAYLSDLTRPLFSQSEYDRILTDLTRLRAATGD